MSLLRVGSLVVFASAVVAMGAVACSAGEDGEDTGAAAEAVTQERKIVVGRCRAPLFVLDPNDALPPAEQVTPHLLRDVTRDEVMTNADLVATVRTTASGKRQVVALDARLLAGFELGNARVTVERTSAMETTLQTSTGTTDYEVRTLTAPRFGLVGALSLRGALVPLGVAVLQREPATGRGWVRFGTHDDKLVAVASNCKFDDRAWTVLADPACEGPLFADAGAGPAHCGVTVADAGADAASADAGADAATSDDAGVDAAAPPAPAEPTETAELKTPDEEDDDDFPEGDYYEPPMSDLGEGDAPVKRKGASSSGCSASPAPTGSGALAALGLVAAALVGRARRRSRR